MQGTEAVTFLYILYVRGSQHSRVATEGAENAMGDTLPQPLREPRKDSGNSSTSKVSAEQT